MTQKTIVRIYTKPVCKQCDMTKMLFDKLGIEYVLEDATDPDNIAAFKELGFLAAPVVAVGSSADDMWAGFQPPRIKEIAARIKEKEGK